jgi:Tfp pilus assembly protein FimT
MNIKSSKGITLIEILLVLGLLVVLLSFAVPSISSAAVKADLRAAMENVQHSLEAARRTARMSESPVFMNISSIAEDAEQTITFSAPGKRGAGVVTQIQDFQVPSDIALVTDQEAFLFDERGLVTNPGQILFVSKQNESVKFAITVQ